MASLAVLLLSILLGGCAASRSEHVQYAPPSFNVQPDATTVAAQREHRLGPNDLVTVTVYRAPEVTGDYRVDQLGNISMPLLGSIAALGLTADELSRQIRQRLDGQFYVNPDVNVALKETTPQTITIDGSVGQPGVYPVTGRTTLMQAVAMARGTTSNANLRRVIVFRQIQGQRQAAGFDLRAIRQSQMEDPVLYPSDIVVVDGSDTRQTWRDVISAVPILALFRPLIF
ncbi:MAG: polysaccharide export protein [Pseudomonadota bacterium]|nr:polysaccharide export protein [Pseudomonadota bacterium]